MVLRFFLRPAGTAGSSLTNHRERWLGTRKRYRVARAHFYHLSAAPNARSRHFTDVAGLTDDVGSWGESRTHGRHRGNDANDPERSSATEQPNPSYAWPHAVILSSVLVMRS